MYMYYYVISCRYACYHTYTWGLVQRVWGSGVCAGWAHTALRTSQGRVRGRVALSLSLARSTEPIAIPCTECMRCRELPGAPPESESGGGEWEYDEIDWEPWNVMRPLRRVRKQRAVSSVK
jgi:hypothetical protein